MYDCPVCDGEVPVGNCWDMLGEDTTCCHCGATIRLDGDYCDDGSWYFNFVLVSDEKKGGVQCRN